MATLESFEIKRDWSIRPIGNTIRHDGWCDVKKGDPYDLLQVSLVESQRYFYFGIPCGTSYEKAKVYATRIAEEFDNKSINLANDLLKLTYDLGCD